MPISQGELIAFLRVWLAFVGAPCGVAIGVLLVAYARARRRARLRG